MKTFNLKISIDRPGQQADMILQESGEFTNENFALIISSIKSIAENFQNESGDVIYDITATITDDTDGSTVTLSGNATKDKMLETAEIFNSLNNQGGETSQVDTIDPIKE